MVIQISLLCRNESASLILLNLVLLSIRVRLTVWDRRRVQPGLSNFGVLEISRNIRNYIDFGVTASFTVRSKL